MVIVAGCAVAEWECLAADEPVEDDDAEVRLDDAGAEELLPDDPQADSPSIDAATMTAVRKVLGFMVPPGEVSSSRIGELPGQAAWWSAVRWAYTTVLPM
jgi:hypothetical protein